VHNHHYNQFEKFYEGKIPPAQDNYQLLIYFDVLLVSFIFGGDAFFFLRRGRLHELRPSCLLGRCSTTWATLPALVRVLFKLFQHPLVSEEEPTENSPVLLSILPVLIFYSSSWHGKSFLGGHCGHTHALVSDRWLTKVSNYLTSYCIWLMHSLLLVTTRWHCCTTPAAFPCPRPLALAGVAVDSQMCKRIVFLCDKRWTLGVTQKQDMPRR
jgi:hypothetical protein